MEHPNVSILYLPMQGWFVKLFIAWFIIDKHSLFHLFFYFEIGLIHSIEENT